MKELSGISMVSLKGPSGETWAVELMRNSSNGSLYLKKGWEVFVEEHNLQENHVLFLKHLGGSVLVFDDENLCENESAYFVRNTCKSEGCHRSNGGLNERRKREPSPEIFEPKIKRSEGKAQVSVKHEQDLEEENNQVNPFALVLRTVDQKEKHIPFQQAVAEGNRRGMPHFVAHPFFMSVPIESARKYIPPGAKDISLRMNDNIWSVKYKTYGTGFGFHDKGWQDFISRNNLKVGDVCLFETTSSPSASSRISKNPVIFAV